MSASVLLDAACRVDVIDVAGRIIANPRRNAVAASASEVLALAHATEKFWTVAIEAEVLVRLLKAERADFATSAGLTAAQAQIVRITDLMNEIRGETNTDIQETNDVQ